MGDVIELGAIIVDEGWPGAGLEKDSAGDEPDTRPTEDPAEDLDEDPNTAFLALGALNTFGLDSWRDAGRRDDVFGLDSLWDEGLDAAGDDEV